MLTVALLITTAALLAVAAVAVALVIAQRRALRRAHARNRVLRGERGLQLAAQRRWLRAECAELQTALAALVTDGANRLLTQIGDDQQ